MKHFLFTQLRLCQICVALSQTEMRSNDEEEDDNEEDDRWSNEDVNRVDAYYPSVFPIVY